MDSLKRPRLFKVLLGAMILFATGQAVALAIVKRDESVPVHHFTVGEAVPAVRLLRLDRAGKSVSLDDILGSSACTMVIFYSSTCPFVRKVLPQWRGVNLYTRGGLSVPIVWVATTAADTGAAHMASSAGLTRPAYAIRSSADARRLGAVATPAAYLLTRTRRVVDIVYPDTGLMGPLPAACGASR